jgi:hypothetical protein
MTDDIVARLRVWSGNAKEQDATEIVVGLCQAADEIELLRAERAEARREACETTAENLSLLGSNVRLSTLRVENADEIERLRKERDEARWRLCKVLGDIRDVWGDEIAIEKGWRFE